MKNRFKFWGIIALALVIGSSTVMLSCNIFDLEEEPQESQEQQELVEYHEETIDISKGGLPVNTTVTGFVTDSQWAAAVPKLKNAIVGEPIGDSMLYGIFMGIPPPVVISKIVLEKNPRYSQYDYAKISKEISFNVDYLINTDQNILNNELTQILVDCNLDAISKVDARDTVRMAKAPVNGKAFAAGIFAQLPQSRRIVPVIEFDRLGLTC
jgi:hypothetical protein